MESNYANFSVSDFAADDHFLQHQLCPTEASANRWNNWLDANPDKRDVWEEAAKLVEAVQSGLSEYARSYLSEEAENHLLQRIIAANTLFEAQRQSRRSVRKRTLFRYATAASLTGLLVVAWLFKDKAVSPPPAYNQLTEAHSELLDETINTTQAPIKFVLADSTHVTLFPGSQLSYSANFGETNRISYLTGQAEFDVFKNPRKPFLVYANEIVTRVLGTRFTIKAYENEGNITVTVATGKVSVFRNEHLNRDSKKENTGEELLLLANQQAVFLKSVASFRKSLVRDPIAGLSQDLSTEPVFIYTETSVSRVFEDIESAYGVDIVYDEEILSGCQLTASLSEESFHQKLEIICKSIGANFEVIDTRIVITSDGCR